MDSGEGYLFIETLWDTRWSNYRWNPNDWFIPRFLARSRSLCIGRVARLIFLLQACEGYAIFLAIYLLLSLEFAQSKSTASLFMHILTPVDLVLLRAWALWGGSRHVLGSIIVGYTAALISIVAGITDHDDIGHSGLFTSRLWIDN